MTGREIPDPRHEPTIRVERAAMVLGISRNAAYSGIETGAIPSLRIGRRIVVPTAALRLMLGLDPNVQTETVCNTDMKQRPRTNEAAASYQHRHSERQPT